MSMTDNFVMMIRELVDQIQRRIDEAEGLYYRLILVVSSPDDGEIVLNHIAEQASMSFINVNLGLSRRMLPLTSRQRALRIAALLDDIISDVDSEFVLLGHINLLFDPVLRQDPLRLLQNLSRRKTIVVVWDGQVQGQYLTYAEPGHPEYRRYSTKELVLISPQEIL